MLLKCQSETGFSLMEVMITLVIIGLLAAIAYPAYTDTVTKSRRAAAQTALLDLQNRMERYFVDHGTYATATIETGAATDVLSDATTENGFYELSIAAQTQTTYTLHATPQGTQNTHDTLCKTLTLDNQGNKGISGGTATDPSQCW